MTLVFDHPDDYIKPILWARLTQVADRGPFTIQDWKTMLGAICEQDGVNRCPYCEEYR